MPGEQGRPPPDRIPVNIRVGIYSVSLTLPFVGLALRLLTGVEAIAALTVTLGAMGPALALTYAPPKDDEDAPTDDPGPKGTPML